MTKELSTGTVKFWDPAKAYGFISQTNGGADVFLHISALERAGLDTIKRGARVSFSTRPDRFGKGPVATDIKILDAAA